MTWHVLWDNGSDACGEFHYDFDTREAADAWGAEWLAEFMITNEVDPDDAELPGYDVIEVVARTTAEEEAIEDYEDELWDMTRRER